jgi:hypothetical protein
MTFVIVGGVVLIEHGTLVASRYPGQPISP